MALNELEQHIRELDAVKNYESLKQNYEALLGEHSSLEGRFSELSSKLEDSEKQNDSIEEKNASLEKVLNDKEERLVAFEREKEGLKGRIQDLEDWKTTCEGKTLKEVEVAVLNAKDDEIRRRSEERFTSIRGNWERKDRPKQLREEAVASLRQVLEILRTPGPHAFPREITEAGIADIAAEVLKVEISKKIDADYLKRVDNGSTKVAKTKLEQLKIEAWPRFVKESVSPMAQQLELMILNRFRDFLNGEFLAVCGKCGTEQRFSLTPEGTELLMTDKHIMIQCAEETCKDLLGRHRIKVTLRELIEALLAPKRPPSEQNT